jgi:hypothetical protein
LDAILTTFQGVTVMAGYRHTITTVAIEALNPDDPAITPAKLPWIGIVPQAEIWTDQCFGKIKVDWPMDIVCHFALSVHPSTTIALATECAEYTTDLRRAWYADNDLGVEGVILTRITGRQGVEGLVEQARMGRGSILLKAMVRFIEEIDET